MNLSLKESQEVPWGLERVALLSWLYTGELSVREITCIRSWGGAFASPGDAFLNSLSLHLYAYPFLNSALSFLWHVLFYYQGNSDYLNWYWKTRCHFSVETRYTYIQNVHITCKWAELKVLCSGRWYKIL